MREILNSAAVDAAVRATAEEIAATTRAIIAPDAADDHNDEVPVLVESFVTNRACASVTIADPLGMVYQAENGALSRAAAAAGLEVTST